MMVAEVCRAAFTRGETSGKFWAVDQHSAQRMTWTPSTGPWARSRTVPLRSRSATTAARAQLAERPRVEEIERAFRDKVVRMWRRIGPTVLQVAEGSF
jgi:hypothetical protein